MNGDRQARGATHRAAVGILMAVGTIGAAVPPGLAAGGGTAGEDRRPGPIRLFQPRDRGSEGDDLLVDAGVLDQLRLTDLDRAVTIEDVPLGGAWGTVDLDLRRFRVTGPGTVFALGGREAGDGVRIFEPDRVVLLRGGVAAAPGSHAFLAVSDLGVLGSIEPGPDAPRFVLTGGAGSAPGLLRGPVRFVEFRQVGGVPPVPPCGVAMPPAPAAPAGPDGLDAAVGRRHLQMAIETDFEYFSLFGDLDAAGAYVVALYGAVSDLYLRDVNTAIELTFVRLWDTPDDLFNEPDPLGPFRTYWNGEMDHVHRDVAQFLTARNLPYGGVAYLNGLCNSSSYSVAGWINGSFADPEAPSPGNWDLVVTAHELGHNCGTAHTHDYGIDDCDALDLQRGSIMSYCHITSGGVANIDLRFHRQIQPHMTGFMYAAFCITHDCNGNFVDDAFDLFGGTSADANSNGVPDECEDCNDNGTLDDADIASGESLDLNTNGIPDECEPDCNRNGVPDDKDIADGTSDDAYGNDIPDECEADCNENDVPDYDEIQADMSRDLDRNAVLDACEDCDGDGTIDLDELAGGLNLWVASSTADFVSEFHGGTGAMVSGSERGHLVSSQDLVIGPDRRVYVTDKPGNRVVVFDAATGAYEGDFVAAGSGGLGAPGGLVFAPDGALLVASRADDAVLEYDGATGAFAGAFVPSGEGGLVAPFGLAFGPDGNLFVTSGDNRVIAYDGTTGAFLETFVTAGSGGLADPRGLLFLPGGALLVASFATDAVLAYDGATGAFLGRFDQGDGGAGYWGLDRPWGMRLGPRGDVVYVASNNGNAAVHAYAVDSGLYQRSYYVLSMDLADPTGVDVMPATANDCNLNLRPDVCDILNGTSADANGNGVPDECEPCGADLDGSGDVGFDDLLAVLSLWGPCDTCPADLDGDGTVGFSDLLIVLSTWGPCP